MMKETANRDLDLDLACASGSDARLPAAEIHVNYDTLILIFTSIIWEALPFIVLGVLLAGILEEYVPQQAIVRIIPKNRFLAIAIGGVLGLVFPMCDCGIIVVMRRLLRKGLPLAVCVSYMLAGPIIQVAVILSTAFAFSANPLYGGALNVVLIRCAGGYLVALGTGLIVDAMERRYGLAMLVKPNVLRGLNSKLELIEENSGPRTIGQRLQNISATALGDFMDIMPFLVIGAFLASAGRLWIQNANLEGTISNSPALAILAMMALGFLFCVCSKADAFIAVNFPAYWPAASKIAFLVFGPMLDFKLVLMYTRVFRPRLIGVMAAAIIVQTFVFAMALHYVPMLAGAAPPPTTISDQTLTSPPPAKPAETLPSEKR
jgi:uncharacterized protein